MQKFTDYRKSTIFCIFIFYQFQFFFRKKIRHKKNCVKFSYCIFFMSQKIEQFEYRKSQNKTKIFFEISKRKKLKKKFKGIKIVSKCNRAGVEYSKIDNFFHFPFELPKNLEIFKKKIQKKSSQKINLLFLHLKNVSQRSSRFGFFDVEKSNFSHHRKFFCKFISEY